MKIAQLICQFRPYKGGMNEVAYHFSYELAKRDHKVTVFTPLYDKKLPKEEEMDGFKIRRMKSLFKYGNAAFIPKIKKELKDFDIVHLHYPFFGTAEILCMGDFFNHSKSNNSKKAKLVITYHMDVIGQGFLKAVFGFHSNCILRRILNCADIITVSSLDYYKNSIAYSEELNKKNKIVELPFGIDRNLYKIMPVDKHFMARYNLEDDDKVILMIGGLDRAHYFKGLEYLIKAFKLVSAMKGNEYWNRGNLKLIIVGEGDLKSYYINLASQLGLANKIIFAGNLDDNEKVKTINLSYMNVLPSIDKSEAFGIVLLEAMACAKPTVASNLPGVRCVVDDNVTGLLSEAKNENNLAGKIKYLLDNPYIARQMGIKGLEKVERIYNWKKITDKLISSYNL